MSTPAARLEELPGLRASLAGRLSVADDESFILMLWALNALQTGRAEVALPCFRGVPDGAATQGILGPHAIYPWELETLGNELLATGKDRVYRIFENRSWSAIADLVNLLRELENAEYGARRDELSIFRELGRIGARQFEWQRGFFTVADIYRSAFIYGQGECARFFEQTYGITIADMVFVGFALRTGFLELPVLRPNSELNVLHDLGLDASKLARVLDRIALPLESIRSEAAALRQAGEAVAYKPSIFRRYPCILVGPKLRRMRVALPDLIGSRVTTGLFYDVVGGGGQIRDDYGPRFEAYVHILLSAMLPGTRAEREWRYRTRLGEFRSPDVVIANPDGPVHLAIECKADWMNINARFGEDPATDRGYDEIAKGVFQAWRFFSHSRRGLTGRTIAPDAKCMILTLHEWFAARSSVLEKVLQRASARADQASPEITAEDRRPVAFCSISELEVVLRTATERSFLATVNLAISDDRRGWMFSSLHDEVSEPKSDPKPYPFEDKIGELLPWWKRLDEEKRTRAEDKAANLQ